MMSIVCGVFHGEKNREIFQYFQQLTVNRSNDFCFSLCELKVILLVVLTYHTDKDTMFCYFSCS